MNHLWKGTFYGDLRSVDVHVRHLRQKVERDAVGAGADPHRARRGLRLRRGGRSGVTPRRTFGLQGWLVGGPARRGHRREPRGAARGAAHPGVERPHRPGRARAPRPRRQARRRGRRAGPRPSAPTPRRSRPSPTAIRRRLGGEVERLLPARRAVPATRSSCTRRSTAELRDVAPLAAGARLGERSTTGGRWLRGDPGRGRLRGRRCDRRRAGLSGVAPELAVVRRRVILADDRRAGPRLPGRASPWPGSSGGRIRAPGRAPPPRSRAATSRRGPRAPGSRRRSSSPWGRASTAWPSACSRWWAEITARARPRPAR